MHWRKKAITLLLTTVVGVLVPVGPLTTAVTSANSDSRFGVAFVSPPDRLADAGRFAHAASLGVGWDRFPMYWHEMQPSRSGPIDFSKTDARVEADLAHGLSVQAILVGAPSWATTSDGVDLDAWADFVSQTVAHYRGTVSHWEMWNEPDLLDGEGRGRYWTWGVAAYYQLLKRGYMAAKAADPNATVILGGLAFPYNNEGFFQEFLAQVAQDPTAKANHGYFDVLAFHSYDRVARMYDLPLGHVGEPSFAGFRPLLRQAGLNPPIWVNELGVPVWDYASGQNAPGRATQDEQASFVVEALASGLAAGVERFFVFQLYDDGAGAIDPNTNQPAEFFGLVANDGAPRPAFRAYQAAIQLFSGVKAATHWSLRRGKLFDDRKGIEVVTLYGTNRGRVTVAWNDDPGDPVTIGIPVNNGPVTVLDKFGQVTGQLTAVGGMVNVTLPPATNNNNFDCFTSHGCDPNDYIIGGSPVILIENDQTVPPVVFEPLPRDVILPVRLSWRPTRTLPADVRYDVQYRDAADNVWRDWLIGTTATEAVLGDGSLPLELHHTYEFRIRARDGAGNLVDGADYPVRPLASVIIFGGDVGQSLPALDARIEIVWPHGGLPVSEATKVNVTAALFQPGTTVSVNPSFNSTLRLWRALNNEPGEPVATGVKRLIQVNDLTYPVWDFNDVDVSAARDPRNKYHFWVTIDGQRTNSSVWTHGSDPRTYFPLQDVPENVLTQVPATIDAKIEIVWPHDDAPVDQATRANVGVALFASGTLQSVPADFAQPVRLYRSLNNGPLQEVAVGARVIATRDGWTYPTWQFNDVDVSAARDPNNQLHFWVAIEGVESRSNVWTHGVDARTYFPVPDVPTDVAP